MKEKIIEHLLQNVTSYPRIGSSALFGKGADEDYVVDFNSLPQEMKGWLESNHTHGGQPYEKAFMNIKSGLRDFLIFKSDDVRDSYLFAQGTLARMHNVKPCGRLEKDKAYRVSRFRDLKEFYMEHVVETALS
tara:strand:- start:31680 stop:32078 length:399 start_codon:yes stop_codon:yes gene_type:complete